MRRAVLVPAIAAVVAAMATALAPAVASASPAGPPGPVVPRLSWGACATGSPADQAGGFQCATAAVPLDYDAPRGGTIELALVRRPATGPGPRIGTLFLNPGGPGGTGTGQVPSWIGLLPKGLQERFDVVSWDPRGIGQSSGVQCFPSGDAEAGFLGEYADFPLTPAQQAGYIDRWRGLGQKCRQTQGELIRHTSTADTARDLNLLRQAVGDVKLSYIGLSYGTFLGATYANLFPDTVRALVLDGNLAPSNWTAGGDRSPAQNLSARVGSDDSAAATLKELLRLCGSTDVAHCAFSAGSPRATAARFDALLARLQKGPILYKGTTITYTALLGSLSDGLDIAFPFPSEVTGGSSSGWTGLAEALQGIWAARDVPVPPAGPTAPAPATAAAYTGPEQALSVICGDAPSPAASRYPALAAAELRRNGPIGLTSLWADEPCSTWPVRADDTYTGPWNRVRTPVLVIGNTLDPSTPIRNSEQMVRQLGDARLLTVQGVGHTVFLNPSACASAAQVAYLVDGKLPRPGTVCRQDAHPFAG